MQYILNTKICHLCHIVWPKLKALDLCQLVSTLDTEQMYHFTGWNKNKASGYVFPNLWFPDLMEPTIRPLTIGQTHCPFRFQCVKSERTWSVWKMHVAVEQFGGDLAVWPSSPDCVHDAAVTCVMGADTFDTRELWYMFHELHGNTLSHNPFHQLPSLHHAHHISAGTCKSGNCTNRTKWTNKNHYHYLPASEEWIQTIARKEHTWSMHMLTGRRTLCCILLFRQVNRIVIHGSGGMFALKVSYWIVHGGVVARKCISHGKRGASKRDLKRQSRVYENDVPWFDQNS